MAGAEELPEQEEQATKDGGETVMPPPYLQRPHDRSC